MQCKRDLTIVWALHAADHPFLGFQNPALLVALFLFFLFFKVHIFHLLGQIICFGERDKRSGSAHSKKEGRGEVMGRPEALGCSKRVG